MLDPSAKKGDKQLLKSYRPVSLLLICRKVLERLFDNSVLKNCLNTISQVSKYVIHVLTSFYLSQIKFANHLMVAMK